MAQENERNRENESDEMEQEQSPEQSSESSERSEEKSEEGEGGQNTKSKRGFAAMDEGKQREIARKGGKSQGKDVNPANFANNREKASEAGRKGGSQ